MLIVCSNCYFSLFLCTLFTEAYVSREDVEKLVNALCSFPLMVCSTSFYLLDKYIFLRMFFGKQVIFQTFYI